MLRVITFEPTDAHCRYFTVAWQAILIGGTVQQGTAGYSGRKAIKQARRIKDALRSVSVQDKPDQPDQRSLQAGGGTCALAEEDFGRLIAAIENVTWTGQAIEDADDTFDFLDASEKKSQSEVAKMMATKVSE